MILRFVAFDFIAITSMLRMGVSKPGAAHLFRMRIDAHPVAIALHTTRTPAATQGRTQRMSAAPRSGRPGRVQVTRRGLLRALQGLVARGRPPWSDETEPSEAPRNQRPKREIALPPPFPL